MAKSKNTVDEAQPEKRAVKITLDKYFRIVTPDISVYQQVYAVSRFRGIMKTKELWVEEMKKFMEDGDV